VIEGPAFVSNAFLDAVHVNALDDLGAVLAGVTENDSVDMVATPGECLGIAADAVIALIEGVR
jgi:hypothetical protein